MGGWGVTNLVNPDIDTTGNAITVNIIPSDVIDDTDAVFWIAPQIYRGNKVCVRLAVYMCLSLCLLVCRSVCLCLCLSVCLYQAR